jgi:hypothetical protein
MLYWIVLVALCACALLQTWRASYWKTKHDNLRVALLRGNTMTLRQRLEICIRALRFVRNELAEEDYPTRMYIDETLADIGEGS